MKDATPHFWWNPPPDWPWASIPSAWCPPTASPTCSSSQSARFRNSRRTNRGLARCPTATTPPNPQPLPPAPFTLNGTLKGPERDVFRYTAKAGERRVIEVEARRCGSAIDPLLEVLDAKGSVIARSEDAPLLGLDSRVDLTFPRDGDYYIVVRDARYSTQTANFYRLKVGTYSY